MDDKHIVAQARRGELSAFEELVTRYEKRVYAIALRSSGSPEDAADITQEVFLRAWRSMKDFRGDSGFATWLFRITMNQCVDYARHKQSQRRSRSCRARMTRNANCRFRIRLHLPRSTWRTASWDASLPLRSMR